MRKIKVLGDALGVVDIVERAAAVLGWPLALKLWQAALIPKLHSQSNDGPALFLENGGYGGRVDASGHGHGDQAGLGFGGDRQGKFELSGFGHQVIIQ
jgi:hypothetical protein